MTKVRSWVGLDVHAAKVIACVVDAESGEMTTRRLPGETVAVVAFCAGLPGPTRAAYEAGPTGYGLARAAGAAGARCVVAAPGKIERPAQDRIKTDQRDAERLVRLLMIDALHAVRVPTLEEESVRDLVRAREDLRGDLMRARHQLSKLLYADRSFMPSLARSRCSVQFGRGRGRHVQRSSRNLRSASEG